MLKKERSWEREIPLLRNLILLIKLPYPFDPSIFPLAPEPEPIFPDDVEKLNARIEELEVENAELITKLN